MTNISHKRGNNLVRKYETPTWGGGFDFTFVIPFLNRPGATNCSQILHIHEYLSLINNTIDLVATSISL